MPSTLMMNSPPTSSFPAVAGLLLVLPAPNRVSVAREMETTKRYIEGDKGGGSTRLCSSAIVSGQPSRQVAGRKE